MTRDEFDKRFDEYRETLRGEIHRFIDSVAVYRQIQERKSDRLEAMNLAPSFFQIVEASLLTTIILWADKLLDEKGDRGLFNFLTFIEHHRKWLAPKELQRRREYPDNHWMLYGREQITVDLIEQDREQIRSLEALKNVRIRRDKFHGHFDKRYFFDRARMEEDAPIGWKDLEVAGEVMGKILNRYSVDYDGGVYSWKTVNIDDLRRLLSVAGRELARRPPG